MPAAARSRYLDADDVRRIVSDAVDGVSVRATGRAIGKSHVAVLKCRRRPEVEAMIEAERQCRAAQPPNVDHGLINVEPEPVAAPKPKTATKLGEYSAKLNSSDDRLWLTEREVNAPSRQEFDAALDRGHEEALKQGSTVRRTATGEYMLSVWVASDDPVRGGAKYQGTWREFPCTKSGELIPSRNSSATPT